MEDSFEKAFTPIHTTRYIVNGVALRDARRKLKVSMKGVADQCGWGMSYQNVLECGDVIDISEVAYKKIWKAFEFLKEIPDFDDEIAALKEKQRKAKKEYGKKMGIKNRGLKF